MLLKFEQSDDYDFLVGGAAGLSDEETKMEYHLKLACDAGLMLQQGIGMYRLTSLGHDYLDAVRDEGIWQSTKAAVAETGGNATLEIIKTVAVGFLKKKISDHTGLDF